MIGEIMIDFWKLFDRIYVINLPSRIDRLQAIEEQMKSVLIPEYHRRDGIIVNEGKILKDREEGCKLAHLGVIQEAKDNNFNRILVLEDDCIFENNTKETLLKYKDSIEKSEYDIFYLGANIYQGRYYSLHAYIVNKSMYDIFLSYKSIDKPIDVLVAEGPGKFYCIDPRIAYQSAGYSDILKQDVFYDQLLRSGK